MILRKPYAFLIKYFRRINIVLLALVLFVFMRTGDFHQFAKGYLETNVYNYKIDAISNYVNGYVIFAFIAIFLICGLLIFLLKLKDKPFISYIIIAVVNLFSFVLLMYSNNYFTFTATKEFKIVTAKTISDLSMIANVLYYPIILILLIRAIGIDLKSFGFQEDKDFVEINEDDREEIELDVGFDKEKWLRKIKYYFRNIKYFVVEKKIQLLGVLGILLLIGTVRVYRYIYVEHRVYKTNETISANYYDMKILDTYLTDKDYNGKIITNDDKYFIVVDFKIKNTVSTPRVFDIEKVLLYIDNKFYVPSIRYNNYFKDMGNLYQGKELAGGEETSYLLIYDVPKPSKKANFVLKYQDVVHKKLVQVKITVLDISTFKNKGEQTYPQMMEVPVNREETMKFKISNYEIGQSANYAYQSCDTTGTCSIYEDTYTASNGKKILHLKFYLEDNERDDFLKFVNNYGKIKYTIDGNEKEVSVKNAIKRKYNGNHVYLLVPDEIENASKVDLLFTIRTYNYLYHLKGE